MITLITIKNIFFNICKLADLYPILFIILYNVVIYLNILGVTDDENKYKNFNLVMVMFMLYMILKTFI